MIKKKETLKEEEVKQIENKVIEQSKKNNKILGGILILCLFIVALFVGFMIKKDVQTEFDYRGVHFLVVDEIAPYMTTINVKNKDSITGAATNIPYNFYIRNDPRELEKSVPFSGTLTLMKLIVFATNESFSCNGKGPVGMMNLGRLLDSFGAEVIADENATCDSQGRYLLVEVVGGNETKIESVGNNCYIMYIKDCEILEATERFMVESMVEANKYLG